MSYKAILEELAGTALNFPGGELTELFKKPDAELTPEEEKAIAEKLKGRYRDVISSINTTNNKALDEKFKAGQRNKAQEFEKLLKENFGIESDKTGPDLIDELKEVVSKAPSGKKKEDLTDDDIKKHPAFIRAETEYKKELKKLQEDKEQSLSALKADYQRKDVFAKVSKEALQKFEELRPVLSSDPKRAAAQKDLFLEKIAAYDYEEVDGRFIPVYKDGENKGKKVENPFGHTLDFEDLVKNTTTSYFDIKVAEDRKAPNGDNGKTPEDTAKQAYTGKLPKTEVEWEQMQSDPNISLADKMKINEHWAKQSATAET